LQTILFYILALIIGTVRADVSELTGYHYNKPQNDGGYVYDVPSVSFDHPDNGGYVYDVPSVSFDVPQKPTQEYLPVRCTNGGRGPNCEVPTTSTTTQRPVTKPAVVYLPACSPGRSGPNCDCDNGGSGQYCATTTRRPTCAPGRSGPSCSCNNGGFGQHCITTTRRTTTTTRPTYIPPCGPGRSGPNCSCTNGGSGPNCQRASQKPTYLPPCGNGRSGPNCSCNNGGSGTNCETTNGYVYPKPRISFNF
jgi:hypothetical protein